MIVRTLCPVIYSIVLVWRLIKEVGTHIVDSFDRDGLAVQSHLIRLHDFLDAGADVVHASVDTGFLEISLALRRHFPVEAYLQAGVRRGLDAFEEVIVDRVVCDGERTIDDASVDMDSKINA